MNQPTLLQEPLLPEYVPEIYSSTQEKKEKKSGSRINPSQLEYLSTMYYNFKKDGKEPSYTDLESKVQPSKTEILENAHWSIYGTQLHSLQYFTQIFKRASYLNRLPSYEDYQFTFLQRDREYYDALLKIQDISDISLNQDSLDISQTYWNEWRMNGHDFTPNKHKNYQIPPTTIKNIWEYGVIPLKDIYTFRESFKESDKLNPTKTVLLNETFLLTNLYFNNGNIQIPTLVDEICIPKDFPNTPIEIIDYKTGKQFKKPQLKERVQIFLIMTGVLTNVLDRVPDIVWEDIPTFRGKKASKKFISSIFFSDLVSRYDVYKDSFRFKYINPLNQESIEVSTKDLGIDSKKGIKDILMYIYSINNFYNKYKPILKHKIDSSRSPYTLPTFPIKNFVQGNSMSKGVQVPLQ